MVGAPGHAARRISGAPIGRTAGMRLLDAVNGEVSFVALVVDRWRTWAIPVIKLICLLCSDNPERTCDKKTQTDQIAATLLPPPQTKESSQKLP